LKIAVNHVQKNNTHGTGSRSVFSSHSQDLIIIIPSILLLPTSAVGDFDIKSEVGAVSTYGRIVPSFFNIITYRSAYANSSMGPLTISFSLCPFILAINGFRNTLLQTHDVMLSNSRLVKKGRAARHFPLGLT